MTVSPDDVALAAVLGVTLYEVLKLRYADRKAERTHQAAQAKEDRAHGLAVIKAGEQS